MQKPSFVPFLTGFRALAAFMIFTIHAGQFIPQQTPVVAKLVAFGGQGVPMFFFLSALTLSLSIKSKQSFSYPKYLLQRVRRIFPLYYFYMFLGFSFEWARRGGEMFREMYNVQPLSFENIFYHVTLLNFFHQKYLLTLTGIDSMIPFELFYYLWIPWLLFLALRFRVLFLFTMLLGAYFYFHPSIHLPLYYTIYGSGELTVERHLLTYTTGIFLFVLLFIKKKTTTGIKKYAGMIMGGGLFFYIVRHLPFTEALIFFGLLLLFCYSYFLKAKLQKSIKHPILKTVLRNGDFFVFCSIFLGYLFTNQLFINLFTTAFIAVLTVVCLTGGKITALLFENKLILHLGEISFSFYLVHLVVLSTIGTMVPNNNLLSFVFLLLITTGIATITQRYIEAPFYKPRVKHVVIK